MSGTPKIKSDFPNAVEKQLIAQVCRRRKRGRAYVAPFARFGFSGARLLRVYLNNKPIGVPYLLKVAKFAKAKKEFAGTRILKSDVGDVDFVEDHLFSTTDLSGQKWGALLHFDLGKRTLRELVYNSGSSPKHLRTILGQVFDGLKDAHSKRALATVPIDKHFEPYFRDHVARHRIRYVLDGDANSERMTFLGAEIYNPLKYLDELPRYASLHVGPVHGDLHPDNVIVDSNEVGHLIDFAWANKSRNILLDFALMETSIRFMAFPRPINLTDQLNVDRALVQEDGFKRIALIGHCSSKGRENYARLASAVGTIRKRARALLGEQFRMQEYLLTQFILLYGLLRYPDYEPYVSTRALGLIAARLKEIKLSSWRVH